MAKSKPIKYDVAIKKSQTPTKTARMHDPLERAKLVTASQKIEDIGQMEHNLTESIEKEGGEMHNFLAQKNRAFRMKS